MNRRMMTNRKKEFKLLQTIQYNGNYTTFSAPKTTEYIFELWGAEGNHSYKPSSVSAYSADPPGKGGYTCGTITLTSTDVLYVYCGNGGLTGTGVTNKNYNGGGKGNYLNSSTVGKTVLMGAGGGATDIRKQPNSTPENASSLNTRIMVAGGGGGGCMYYRLGDGGAAGGLTAYLGGYANGSPASQTQGGYNTGNNKTNGNPGGFGYGGDCGFDSVTYSAGGGSGWYGGPSGGISHAATQAGGGGSSYISGHPGCAQSHHGVFRDTRMIDGNGYEWGSNKGNQVSMPNPNGGNYSSGVGHSGHGFCKIYIYD